MEQRQPWVRTVLATERRGARAGLAAAVRVLAAAVFISFGVAKFTNHPMELASFRLYGLPAPDTFVYSVGVLEIGGGVLLAAGFLVRPAALLLAGDMVGAIVVSGLGRGENISLTLAPLMLVAMCFLIRTGAGRAGVDTHLTRRVLMNPLCGRAGPIPRKRFHSKGHQHEH